MAKGATVRLELTKSVVAGLEFNSPVVGLAPNGSLITGELAPKATDWVLRDKTLPGFMVRVYASKKVFQVQRKMKSRLDPIDALNSAPIKRVVGTVGEISVADARNPTHPRGTVCYREIGRAFNYSRHTPINENGSTPSTGVWSAGKGVQGITPLLAKRPKAQKGAFVVFGEPSVSD